MWFLMKYIICYDIKDDKLRNKVMKYLETIATRLQFSVFTCELVPEKSAAIWKKLLKMTSAEENCLLLMAPLCKNCSKDIRIKGNPLESENKFLVV